MSWNPSRWAAVACLVLLAGSFLLPVVKPILETAATPGWRAFWLSLSSWGSIDEWDSSVIPIVLAWAANVGALLGALMVLRRPPPRGVPAWLPLVLGLLGVGPLFSAPRELMIGYWVWLVAVLGLGVLALLSRSRSAGVA